MFLTHVFDMLNVSETFPGILMVPGEVTLMFLTKLVQAGNAKFLSNNKGDGAKVAIWESKKQHRKSSNLNCPSII